MAPRLPSVSLASDKKTHCKGFGFIQHHKLLFAKYACACIVCSRCSDDHTTSLVFIGGSCQRCCPTGAWELHDEALQSYVL